MTQLKRPISILLADDDSDDILLTRKAFKANRLANQIDAVGDGEELLDYLLNRGIYADKERYSRPGVLFLDLNMPRMSGKEALVEIRANHDLRSLPIVVLTTSASKDDIREVYDLGANSYIVKPVTFHAMIGVVKTIGSYWFEIVELPHKEASP